MKWIVWDDVKEVAPYFVIIPLLIFLWGIILKLSFRLFMFAWRLVP